MGLINLFPIENNFNFFLRKTDTTGTQFWLEGFQKDSLWIHAWKLGPEVYCVDQLLSQQAIFIRESSLKLYFNSHVIVNHANLKKKNKL